MARHVFPVPNHAVELGACPSSPLDAFERLLFTLPFELSFTRLGPVSKLRLRDLDFGIAAGVAVRVTHVDFKVRQQESFADATRFTKQARAH